MLNLSNKYILCKFRKLVEVKCFSRGATAMAMMKTY